MAALPLLYHTALGWLILKEEYSMCYLELNSPSANGKPRIPWQHTMHRTTLYRTYVLIQVFQAGFLKRLN